MSTKNEPLIVPMTTEPQVVATKMERPSKEMRLRTGVRAGEGSVMHVDKWNQRR